MKNDKRFNEYREFERLKDKLEGYRQAHARGHRCRRKINKMEIYILEYIINHDLTVREYYSFQQRIQNQKDERARTVMYVSIFVITVLLLILMVGER